MFGIYGKQFLLMLHIYPYTTQQLVRYGSSLDSIYILWKPTIRTIIIYNARHNFSWWIMLHLAYTYDRRIRIWISHRHLPLLLLTLRQQWNPLRSWSPTTHGGPGRVHIGPRFCSLHNFPLTIPSLYTYNDLVVWRRCEYCSDDGQIPV